MPCPRRIFALSLLAVGFAQLAGAKDKKFFIQRVDPILREHCLPCHNDSLKDGDISFADRASLTDGTIRKPVIVPGNPEESLLIHAVRQDGDVKMPPGGKLSERDIATLIDWVKRGAPWGKPTRRFSKTGDTR